MSRWESSGSFPGDQSPGVCPVSEVLGLLRDAARFRARSTSHSVAVRDGCTKIPLTAGRAQEDENLSRNRLFRPRLASVRPPGSVRTDPVPRITELNDDGPVSQAGLIIAPSITTPALTNFQSATSSFRASATIVVLRRRPPLRSIRSLNQRVSAETGWWRIQSQAS